MSGDANHLNIIACPDDHLHCNGCDEVIAVDNRMPILLIPVIHAESGERAYSAICPDCAIPLLLEGLVEAKQRAQRKRDSLN